MNNDDLAGRVTASQARPHRETGGASRHQRRLLNSSPAVPTPTLSPLARDGVTSCHRYRFVSGQDLNFINRYTCQRQLRQSELGPGRGNTASPA